MLQRVLQGSYKGVKRVLQGFYKGVQSSQLKVGLIVIKQTTGGSSAIMGAGFSVQLFDATFG